MEETMVTDISFLKHFTSGDTQMITNLINVFFTTAKDKLDKLEVEIEKKDLKRVRDIVHSFKPQLSYMGIKSAEEIVRRIEDSADSVAIEESIPSLVDSLKSIVETATIELKKVSERLA